MNITIVVEIEEAERRFELTTKEAQELYNRLHELFGARKAPVIGDPIPYVPTYPAPTTPITIPVSPGPYPYITTPYPDPCKPITTCSHPVSTTPYDQVVMSGTSYD